MPQPLSNWVFVREVALGEHFINDAHLLAVASVLVSKEAAFHQRNAQRLGGIWTHSVANAGRFILSFRSTFNDKRREVRDAKGKPIRYGDRSDAGQAADFLLQLLEEVRYLLTIGVVDRHLHGKEVLRVKSRVNLQHTPEALNERSEERRVGKEGR